MIHIRKGAEPKALREYRSQPGATYEDFRDKRAIRAALLKEQGHICAYCMKRITIDSMKIEHWDAQNAVNDTGIHLTLDYGNMLGVCTGNEGAPHESQTCDSHKGNDSLIVNPLRADTLSKISYLGNGIIYSDDPVIDHDLKTTLNLNCAEAYLPENRKAALQALQRYLMKAQPDKTWSATLLRKAQSHFQRLDASGCSTPYLGIILYYIDRYIKKAQ